MSQLRMLKEEELNELQEWLNNNHNIKITTRLRRDYTDVVPVALLFKRIHNRLVEMHNYTPCNGFTHKLQSWELFNKKVLRKLDIQISTQMLKSLAQGTNNAIDYLLYELMCSERNKPPSSAIAISRNLIHDVYEESKDEHQQQQRHHDNDAGDGVGDGVDDEDENQNDEERRDKQDGIELQIPISQVQEICEINKNGEQIKSLMVPLQCYELLQRKSKEKDNYITILTRKLEYLESIIKMKDDRISDLREQMSQLSLTVLSKQNW